MPAGTPSLARSSATVWFTAAAIATACAGGGTGRNVAQNPRPSRQGSAKNLFVMGPSLARCSLRESATRHSVPEILSVRVAVGLTIVVAHQLVDDLVHESIG